MDFRHLEQFLAGNLLVTAIQDAGHEVLDLVAETFSDIRIEVLLVEAPVCVTQFEEVGSPPRVGGIGKALAAGDDTWKVATA